MRIAYTMTRGRGALDRTMEDFANALARQGIRVCGIVQTNTNCAEGERCDMDVRVLPDGPVLRISQNLGKGSRGCRLDPEALETAVASVARSMQDGCDIFLLNKFGKQEADGRGFRDLIAEALSRDATVVTGVNGANTVALDAFTDGGATYVRPDVDHLLTWYLSGDQSA